MSYSHLTTLSKLALLLSVLGLVIGVQSLTTSTVNGVTQCSFIDYGALLFGAAGAFAGSLGEVRALGMAEGKLENLIVSGAAVMIGIFNVLRGLGVIWGPC
ncbi:hypothetical protein roselon_01772 [Roseibacterium elongatum DSM 19469]|uniref:Uncharacterized protein n=1 Tax=Roseicyclus elongatus DSM 19469 TaxID=1294273 RepID=W8RSN1_9RHOB|nr:hypothetical protein [Roseibacterium elongatum]AHM04138.1 hypothetical protein roselon_01772 [Roseibacterium elongatum DSM 19469]